MGVQAKIELDLAAFSIDSIKRAAYRHSDRFAFDVTTSSNVASCTLIFPDGTSSESVQLAVCNFRKEVLDQDLRATIRAETETIRNVILAHAFSRTGLVKSEPVQDD